MSLFDFLQGASNAAASNVSGPVDLIGAGLRLMGVPVQENALLSSKWMEEKGLTRKPKNAIAGLFGEAAGLSAPIAMAAKAPQMAAGLLSLDDKAMDMARQAVEGQMVRSGGLQPATVWHGSPHKFDKFDAAHIGKGEGAQAYGHGLYLAETPEVARTYKSAGVDASKFVPVRSIRDPAQMAATALERAGGDMRYAQAVLAQNAQSGDITAGSALELLKKRAALPESKYAGNMYKVDLPDEQIARMLDWDKPLSQQAPVLAAMERAGYKPNPSMTAGQFIESKQAEGFAQYLSDDLRKQGIPGIRYLDGGSRGAGQGTSNYVVFPGEERMLRILERNGNPLLMP